MIGEAKFKSGCSYGSGLTEILQLVECEDGITYGDTPGLSDTHKRKKAAEEITKALQ